MRRSRGRIATDKPSVRERVYDMDEHRAEIQRAARSIAIGIPSHDQMPFLSAIDLAQLTGFTVAALPDNVALSILALPGTYVHSARQDIADAALEQGHDWLLWVDSDMRLPSDALVRLMKHNVDIVGINYAKRGIPSDYVAIKKVGWNPGERSERLVTNEKSTGLEEVDAIGFGCVLMKTSVLRALPDPKKQPWFWFEWKPEIAGQVGEDVFFCRLAQEHGFKIHVDHDLSKECAHVGQWEYKLDHVHKE